MTMGDLRLLVDHNVGRGVARALSRAGYDTLFVGDDERIRIVLSILEQHGAALSGRFSVFEGGRLRIR
jgi:hypothetical protein